MYSLEPNPIPFLRFFAIPNFPFSKQGVIFANKVSFTRKEEPDDEILYSPLMRAADTAKHISEVTGIPAREELRLKEQNFGKYESTPRNGEEFKRAKQDFVCRYEGGESMLQLCQRIYNLLDDIKKEDKVYLLVAHNGISRAIESYVRDMSNEEFAGFGIKNCELRKYEF